MTKKSLLVKINEGFGFILGLFEPKLTLRFKILFLIILVSLIVISVSTFLSLSYQRQQLFEAAQSATTALSNAIVANLQHAMLTNDQEMINMIIQVVASEKTVESLQILNDQGLVVVSSEDGNVGIRFRQSDTLCQSCHVDGNLPKTNNIVFNQDNGQEVLLNVNLIQNQPECYACHNPENRILGLMMIKTSLSKVNAQLNSGLQQTSLIALVAFALLTGLVIPALNWQIIRPIKELSKGVVEISGGNLDFQVPVIFQDELGNLAKSFDNMRRGLKNSRAEMFRREQELAILNEIGLAATQLLDLQEILALALGTIGGKLGMDNVLIYLWDESTRRYTLQASHGISDVQIDEIERRRQSGQDITQEIVESGQEVFVPNMAADPRFSGVWEDLEDRSYVKLPLMSRGAVVGVLGVVTPVGQSFKIRDVEFLKIIGRQIGIAIDNANLLAETRRREKQAITLYKLGMGISASLSLEDVLDEVADAAKDLMGADLGLVGLMDEVYKSVIIKAVAGDWAKRNLNKRMKVSKKAPWNELRAGQPYIANLNDPDLHYLHEEDMINGEGIESLLAVPLHRGGHFLGLIEVMTRNAQPFRQRDGRLLSRLANQVVVAVENAQLYRQLHHLVALEERDRLARELHDHLAQGIAYLKVKASITDDLLSVDKIEEAQENLLELRKASQILYTDVREEIFNLRTAATYQDSFLSTLQDNLVDYQLHYGLNVNMMVENEKALEFPAEVTSQLLRIIQEALTNVRRHSDARNVLIHCYRSGGQVCICIEDNGQGFHPDQVAKEGGQRYGLQIMVERAESVGGSLEFDSQLGVGTRVIVRLPV